MNSIASIKISRHNVYLRQNWVGAAMAAGPLGNLRHDSALMGALTNTKGKQALPERVPVSIRTFLVLCSLLPNPMSVSQSTWMYLDHTVAYLMLCMMPHIALSWTWRLVRGENSWLIPM